MASTPVQKELRKIAADYRRYQILRGLAASWAVVAGVGVLCLLAYWAAGLFIPYSAAILVGGAVLAAGYVFWCNERTDVALREIARLIEKDDPKLNTLLLAAAEQQPDPKTGELNFLQTRVIQEAIEANRRAPWNIRFSKRLAWVQTVHLLLLCGLAAVVLACAMTAQRGSTTKTLARLGFGVEITPGNTTVEKGSTVAILAKFGGNAPTAVNLIYQPANGEEKKLPMARSLSDPLFGVTLPELQEKTFYRIEYEGRQSEQFTADIFEYPDLKRADAELKFPEYTGFAASKIEDTRRVTAVEGTDVRYTFFLNKPVKSARLLGTNETQIVLTNNGVNAVQYAADFRLMESGHFRLELVDEAGRTNKIPPDFVFAALENQRPKLKLKAPRGDGRVSALEEVAFNAQAEDDFGLAGYGLAYRMAGKETKLLSLSQDAPATKGLISKPHEAHDFGWMLALEKLKAEPGQLVSYYLWADDLGPDGKPRRTESDMYFAEVRPFEEIFREGDSNNGQQQQQQQGQQQNPATKLLELEKQIITATWNLQRREIGAKPTPAFKKDSEVVRDSQQQAWQQAEELKEKLTDEKSHAIIENVITAMDNAVKNLKTATSQNAPKSLPPALEFEQSAYQGLLRLQAREYQVSRSRSQGGQQSSRGERAQRQLDQLELKEEQNRYETESQATPLQSAEQRETLQVLNRLKELARRQEDMSERLKELQSALNEAKTKEEKEKLERMLKRLQEEQQQIVQDTDELKQRMQQPENQSRMADAQKQLDKSREQSREAAQQLQEGNVGQALSSSARAQKELQDLSNDFRKATSGQFTEQMRDLREKARELSDKQQQLEQKLQEIPETRQRTLSDQGPKKEINEGIAQQRSAFTNILENIRQVTEQAEAAEPLLARQLYETWRKASQTDLEKNMQIASQALDRNIVPIAREALKRTDRPVKDLREGVEQAARGVLGDEAESLRFAEKELQDLADRVQKELDRARGVASTNGGTNMMAGARGQRGTNSASAFAQSGSTNRAGARQPGSENGQGQGQPGERQLALNDSQGQQQEGEQGQRGQQGGQGERGQQGQRGQRDQRGAAGQQNGEPQSGNGQQQAGGAQNGEQPGGEQATQQASVQGQQPGEQGQEGQQGQQGQTGQQGQRGPGQRGQGGRAGQVPQQGQPGNEQQNGQQQQAGARFFEQWANGGRAGGGAVTDGTNAGPLTGTDYTAWSDRLRNLEEILQNPQLRNQAAEILDRARGMRMDFTKRGIQPRWDLVNTNLLKPMRILQNRVAEELARLGPRDAVVPVDRDPVPQKYTDLVSRYYERLGKD